MRAFHMLLDEHLTATARRDLEGRLMTMQGDKHLLEVGPIPA
jgi:hypothetical protein